MEVNRTEHKYMLTIPEACMIQKRLQHVIPLDSHCIQGKGYEVRSLYFDTIKNRSCYEKLDGDRIHEKIRLRIYGNDDSIIKLESKWKDGMSQIKKTMLIPKSLAIQLCHGTYDGLKDFDHPYAFYFYQRLIQGMVPKVIIQYQRLSYCLATNNTRITFDSNICATENNMDLFCQTLQTRPVLAQSHLIMEVKFNGFLLNYIKRELQGAKKLSSSYSKYTSGRMFY